MRALALYLALAAGPAAAQVAGPCPDPLPDGTERTFAEGAVRVTVAADDGGQSLYVEAAGTCTAVIAAEETPFDVAALASAQEEAHPTRGVTIKMPVRTLFVEGGGQAVYALGLTVDPATGALTLKRLAGDGAPAD
ncbi:hypothetical protein [Wenxinia marina]|uniref:PepSY domain-containing protein n=1 Tax=Wenxinia marina DSM 24838 TaxID=1123501 RepID=A0A0D0NLM8_9RHOB|nr:hypothetical protein [Wenxinia marina]KIQ69180.1 hypothetical protein Wenmar_02250 [Wenxinia marina DSM 24838]GGL70983.1 hypothetical protein GCM10011392_26900 [Wenxinia marina]